MKIEREGRLIDFSLVLGTVERTHDLEHFLASLDAQTYRNFELIVVDQNKDERLESVLAPYASRFPVLHLRSEPGLTRAKNVGLKRVTGNVVGFPDDNCRFPPDLLEKVARFFADHPQVDGLTGRSADDSGRDSIGTYDREGGVVDKFNLWHRSTAYTIFLRRDTAQGVQYDEEMGPGAGTIWGAGDESEYLLKVLERGASVLYDPQVLVIHPIAVTQFDASAMHRAYTYNCGKGRAIRRHGFPWRFKAWWLVRPLGGVVLRLVRLEELPVIQYQWAAFKGRFRGLFGSQAG
jgi:glycosyltransferase involved in cell wall biosynthesis